MQQEAEINYLEIFRESFRVIWQKKMLCVFGFFIMLGSGMNGFTSDWEKMEGFQPKSLLGNIIGNEFLLAFLFLFFLLVVFLLVALRIIAQASLITAVGNENQPKEFSFSFLFRQGKTHLKKLFLLDILFAVSLLVFLFVLLLPVISLVLAKSKLLALLVGMFALLIFIPVYILAYFVKKFAYMYIVLSNLSIRSSIESAYKIFKDNIGKVLLFTLFLLGIGLLFGIALIASLLIAGLPLLLIGAILSLIFAKAGLYFSIGFGILLLVIIFAVAQSFIETFGQISWTLLFKKLAGIKISQEESEEKIITEETMEPERA